MISSKKLFYIAVAFLAAADLLALTFPNSAPLGVAIFTLLHIPLEYKSFTDYGDNCTVPAHCRAYSFG